jgi:hypothetical protein
MKKLRLIILAPFLMAIMAWWFYSQAIQPQPAYVTADPEIAYLLSSLSTFTGNPYTFIDHPGTPVEILGTLVLGITYPLMGNAGDSFIISHITQPETFMIIVRSLLTVASIGTMIALTVRSLRGEHWTDAVAAVAIAVLFFGIHPRAFNSIVHWSHNSFSFPLGTLLGLSALLLVVERGGRSKRQIAILGFSLGILAAIQLFFFTWILGAAAALFAYFALCFNKWKRGLTSVLILSIAAVTGFILSTLPIINRYQEFFSWVCQIASHQGRHGSGPTGFISLQGALANFIGLWHELPLLFISLWILILGVVFLAISQRRYLRSNAGLWATALGLIFQTSIMCALVLKHPGVIYMQAVAATLPLLLGVAIPLMELSIPKRISTQRLIKFGLSLGIFILFLLGFIRALIAHSFVTQQVQSAVEEINTYLDEYSIDQGDDGQALTILWIYGMPSECAALWYGSQYSDYALAEEIATVCPNDLIFNLWENRVVLADGASVRLENSNWDVILAHEAALIDFPNLRDLGEIVYADSRLGTFGRVVYVLHTGND